MGAFLLRVGFSPPLNGRVHVRDEKTGGGENDVICFRLGIEYY